MFDFFLFLYFLVIGLFVLMHPLIHSLELADGKMGNVDVNLFESLICG